MCLLEHFLQFFQLQTGKSGPVPSLLTAGHIAVTLLPQFIQLAFLRHSFAGRHPKTAAVVHGSAQLCVKWLTFHFRNPIVHCTSEGKQGALGQFGSIEINALSELMLNLISSNPIHTLLQSLYTQSYTHSWELAPLNTIGHLCVDLRRIGLSIRYLKKKCYLNTYLHHTIPCMPTTTFYSKQVLLIFQWNFMLLICRINSCTGSDTVHFAVINQLNKTGSEIDARSTPKFEFLMWQFRPNCDPIGILLGMNISDMLGTVTG